MEFFGRAIAKTRTVEFLPILLYYNHMSTQTIIFLSSGIIILLLAAVNIFLIFYLYRTNSKLDKLLEKGKIKDFKSILLAQKDRNDDLEEKIKEAFSKIKNIEDVCETTIQKVGIVRFNPFNEMGGNQSFVVALLDNKNNGFLISSLFIKDGSRVYAKTIKQGKPDYLLSNEESEAINRAMKSK